MAQTIECLKQMSLLSLSIDELLPLVAMFKYHFTDAITAGEIAWRNKNATQPSNVNQFHTLFHVKMIYERVAVRLRDASK